MKNCLYCGKEIKQGYYCSNLCYNRHLNQIYPQSKSCVVCGQSFTTYYNHQILCGSPHCKKTHYKNLVKEYHRKKRLLKKPVIKTCKFCGKQFTYGRLRVFCSDSCNRHFFQRIDYHKKNPATDTISAADAADLSNDFFHAFDYLDNSNIDDANKKAAECGLSYGKFKAQLRLGKSFEQLKAEYQRSKSDDSY